MVGQAGRRAPVGVCAPRALSRLRQHSPRPAGHASPLAGDCAFAFLEVGVRHPGRRLTAASGGPHHDRPETFSRPGRGSNPFRKDITLTGHAIDIQIADLKHGGRTDRERIVIYVSRRLRPTNDAPFDLVYGHISAVRLCTDDAYQPFFKKIRDLRALSTEVASVWMREGLRVSCIHAQDGAVCSGHSLRALSTTSYRAIRGGLDAIAQVMGMKNKAPKIVSASSVDSPAMPNDAARELLEHFFVTRR